MARRTPGRRRAERAEASEPARRGAPEPPVVVAAAARRAGPGRDPAATRRGRPAAARLHAAAGARAARRPPSCPAAAPAAATSPAAAGLHPAAPAATPGLCRSAAPSAPPPPKTASPWMTPSVDYADPEPPPMPVIEPVAAPKATGPVDTPWERLNARAHRDRDGQAARRARPAGGPAGHHLPGLPDRERGVAALLPVVRDAARRYRAGPGR